MGHALLTPPARPHVHHLPFLMGPVASPPQLPLCGYISLESVRYDTPHVPGAPARSLLNPQALCLPAALGLTRLLA